MLIQIKKPTSIVDDAVVQDPFHISKKCFSATIHFLFDVLEKKDIKSVSAKNIPKKTQAA